MLHDAKTLLILNLYLKAPSRLPTLKDKHIQSFNTNIWQIFLSFIENMCHVDIIELVISKESFFTDHLKAKRFKNSGKNDCTSTLILTTYNQFQICEILPCCPGIQY